MKLIKYLRIDNFRSIRSAAMLDIDSYAPIIGLNSAGKSNVLRALNLFFNGFVDESRTPLSMTDDFSSHAPTGKKKIIGVTVGLHLDENFRVRGQDEFHKAHGITDTIYIRREWSLTADKAIFENLCFGATLEDLVAVDADTAASVLTHIRAIRFVYVPNHTRPADLIRQELEPLRGNLVSRLRSTKAYRDSSVGGLLDELTAMGDRMFGEVSRAVGRGLPGVEIQADLPGDFADLVFNVGVRAATGSDAARTPDFEGSGAQSLMLLHVLNLADRTLRGSGFGWMQASVWAIEEPESFLHAALRARFSADLREYADDTKRQVFVTTHQDEFVRVAEAAWFAEKNPDTELARMTARQALQKSAKTAISSYSHPLVANPSEPIVIVEGAYDDEYLRAAIAQAELRPRWRLVSPSTAFGEDIGGDSLLQYLRYNKQVISSRPDAAPVIVIRDWEATDQVKYNNILAVHPYSACLIAPASLTNPELDESFVGIERFLTVDFIDTVVSKTKLGRESGEPGARYTIKRETLSKVKSKLAARAREGEPVGPHLQSLAEWIDQQVVSVLSKVPSSAFL